MRWLTGSIPDWEAHFRKAYEVTKPGGWVQSYEPSSVYRSDHVEISADTALSQWGHFFAAEGGKATGNTFFAIEDDLQRKSMEAAGFVDIQEFLFKVCTPL